MSKSAVPVIRMTVGDLGEWASIRTPGVIEAEAEARGCLMLDAQREGPARVYSGVWEATAHVEKIRNFDKDEIMFLLEGSCEIVDDTGHVETFHPGDVFLMPKGFNGEWRHDQTVRKFYLIVDYGVAD